MVIVAALDVSEKQTDKKAKQEYMKRQMCALKSSGNI